MKFRNIFDHYRTLTTQEVADSCSYYHRFVTFEDSKQKTCSLAKEMTWSYYHFQKHVEPGLYDTVNAEFRLFDSTEKGGPLFLKLLLDHLTVSNEEQLSSLTFTTFTYNIKTMSETENIIEVVKLLSSETYRNCSLCNQGPES